MINLPPVEGTPGLFGKGFNRTALSFAPTMSHNRKKIKAPAAVIFTSKRNLEGKLQLCVFAQCLFSGQQVGPIWSHTKNAVKRALATLTCECECPAKFHQAREFMGKQILPRPEKK